MSDARIEKVIQEIQSLSNDQLKEISRVVNKKLAEQKSDEEQSRENEIKLPFKPRIAGPAPPPKDRSRENTWLEKHRDEYDGQWVALDGDRLLAHGPKLKEVAAAARAAGVPDALMFIVEGSNTPPFAGF
jgi:hypothetical protein